ncbi:selenocysteine-specific translation elongation factor [Tetragenococcus koreensis]|uniref:selenocysteine-specific translation elongation factor n=1 Tax=Tetragenococcus koreensis TaxID=290335 RepID=UPI001F384C79|nr:selenocysteine-specific translation elongation factor [Tetragenococcus koreensis]MDN6640149.1 selenocysteine-specific translation elongation factor [Tetragenococcus sp.]MDN6834729.1 selenocysteine-specific translation elongation factor [Lactococcus lactis]MDN6839650.1 selenocysteine-specific translation elongation factor [Tetragenococcus halophilus]MCF1586178.1 selenocysteine-specific translation elongation factor [Tetragenococcus koreensis]MCF1615762.1 selenocysteine-specific translation e
MANIVIGTAGHIDHGKTTLIKALTGIETDTTKEEKKHGMSINLGFAYLDLPNNKRVGIVDVPGHEKFIKNMVAGLPGINLVLLVIDAAEGIMPQTKEHIDILTLLGIRDFLIVLTKVDTVDPELKELVIEDIRDQLADTPLADAELIETDAVTGTGIKELLTKIQARSEEVQERSESGLARLNVDRVFSVKGFGTVVTGTLLDGSINIGDDLYLYPSEKKTRVRNIQVHETDVKNAQSGQRTALNLANIATDDIKRGDVLSVSEKLEDTWMLDVKVTCLPEVAGGIGLWDRVRLLIGTREVMARTVPLGIDWIGPGEEGFLQLRLEEQVAVKERDRFILRSYSPMQTIAGGEVLDAAPHKHRRFKVEILESLKAKEEGSLDELITDFLINKKQPFTNEKVLLEYLGVAKEELQPILVEMEAEGRVIKTKAGYLAQASYQKLADRATEILSVYHKQYRLRFGMPLEEFRSRMRGILAEKEISALIALMKETLVKEANDKLALVDFNVSFNKYQQIAKEKIEQTLAKNGYTPAKKEELFELDKNAEEVLEALNGDSVVFLTHEYVLLGKIFDQAVNLIREYITENNQMTLGDFRDLTKSSRKSSMLILEYMDKQEITKRVENYRVLGKMS